MDDINIKLLFLVALGLFFGLPLFLFALGMVIGLCRTLVRRADVDEGQSFGGEYHD